MQDTLEMRNLPNEFNEQLTIAPTTDDPEPDPFGWGVRFSPVPDADLTKPKFIGGGRGRALVDYPEPDADGWGPRYSPIPDADSTKSQYVRGRGRALVDNPESDAVGWGPRYSPVPDADSTKPKFLGGRGRALDNIGVPTSPGLEYSNGGSSMNGLEFSKGDTSTNGLGWSYGGASTNGAEYSKGVTHQMGLNGMGEMSIPRIGVGRGRGVALTLKSPISQDEPPVMPAARGRGRVGTGEMRGINGSNPTGQLANPVGKGRGVRVHPGFES